MMVVLRGMFPPPSQPFSSTATSVMPCRRAGEGRGAQAVAAGADHAHLVATLRLGVAPQPVGVLGRCGLTGVHTTAFPGRRAGTRIQRGSGQLRSRCMPGSKSG